MVRKLVPLAIAYDFDGTLAPGNMQEHQFLPDIGVKADDFWAEVKRLTKQHQADEVLIYMNLMLRKAGNAGVAVRKEDFELRGKKIKLFDGVTGWFDRIDKYGKLRGVRVEHFLVSSGNAEIFAGTPIAAKFTRVYASKFMFDENGVAVWPALAVNYTTKTQYLFRINKGAHDLADKVLVNQYVEKKDRPIPFENIIFIGDGASDVPCFRLVKEQGGFSIAVFEPRRRGARDEAERFHREGRVHCVAPATYTSGGKLDRLVKASIDAAVARQALETNVST